AHGATGTASGVNAEDLGSLLHRGNSFTNAPGGTANWTFDGDINYNPASGSVAIAIAKANATLDVLGYNGTYDGHAHGLTGPATVVNCDDPSALHNLGSSSTNAGNYSESWSFAGSTNYNSAAGTATIDIAKADAPINVLVSSGIFFGFAHGATGTATGVQGED